MAKTESLKPKQVRIECDECGGGFRNHEVVCEHVHHGGSEHSYQWGERDQICKCLGCDAIRFRRETWNSDDLDEDGDPETSVRVFPSPSGRRSAAQRLQGLPDPVGRIYNETVIAFSASARTLAGGGLRAIVEAVCLQKRIPGANLQKRIDALASAGLLAQAQADLLHEERYLGNAALHEMDEPALKDIEAGLEIIETLLSTIYIAPMQAARLRRQRESRNKKRPKKVPAKRATP